MYLKLFFPQGVLYWIVFTPSIQYEGVGVGVPKVLVGVIYFEGIGAFNEKELSVAKLKTFKEWFELAKKNTPKINTDEINEKSNSILLLDFNFLGVDFFTIAYFSQ